MAKSTIPPFGHKAITGSRQSANVTLLVHRVADLSDAGVTMVMSSDELFAGVRQCHK